MRSPARHSIGQEGLMGALPGALRAKAISSAVFVRACARKTRDRGFVLAGYGSGIRLSGDWRSG